MRTLPSFYYIYITIISVTIFSFCVQNNIQLVEAADNGTDFQFPFDSEPYNLTWADWSAEFWRWDMSIPLDKSPADDDTGKYCAENQKGDVWFLIGTPKTNELVERNCTIPSDKAIFIAVIGTLFTYADTPTAKTEADLRYAANTNAEVQASVDGVDLGNLRKQWLTYPLFNITMAENNVFGAPVGLTHGVSSGYYVFLKPLSPGMHEVHWYAKELGPGNFNQNVTYHLNVKP